jgi:hypothetical protein
MPLLVALSLGNASLCESSPGASCAAALHVGSLVLSAHNVEFLAISAVDVAVDRPGVVDRPLRVVNIGDIDGNSIDEFALFSAQFTPPSIPNFGPPVNLTSPLWRACVRIGSVETDRTGSSLSVTLSDPVPLDRLLLDESQCASSSVNDVLPTVTLVSPSVPPALSLAAPPTNSTSTDDVLYVGLPAARSVYAFDVVKGAASPISPCSTFRRSRLVRSEPDLPGFGARVFSMLVDTAVDGLLVVDHNESRHLYRIDVSGGGGNVSASHVAVPAVDVSRIVGSSGGSLRVLSVGDDSDGNGVDELFVGLAVSEVASPDAAAGSTANAQLPPKRAFLAEWFTTAFMANVTGVRWFGGAMNALLDGKIIDQPVIRSRANMNPYSKLTRTITTNSSLVLPNRAVYIVSYRAGDGTPTIGFVPASVAPSDDFSCARKVVSSLVEAVERTPLPSRIGTAVAKLDLFLPPDTMRLSWFSEDDGLLVAWSSTAALAFLIEARSGAPHFTFVDDMLMRRPRMRGVRLVAELNGIVLLVDSEGEQLWYGQNEVAAEPPALPFLEVLRRNEAVFVNGTGQLTGILHSRVHTIERTAVFPRGLAIAGLVGVETNDTLLLQDTALGAVSVRSDNAVVALAATQKNMSLFYQMSLADSSELRNRQAPIGVAIAHPVDTWWTSDGAVRHCMRQHRHHRAQHDVSSRDAAAVWQRRSQATRLGAAHRLAGRGPVLSRQELCLSHRVCHRSSGQERHAGF